MKELNDKLSQFSERELNKVAGNALRKGANVLRKQAKSNLVNATFSGKKIKGLVGKVHYSTFYLPDDIKQTKPNGSVIKVHIFGKNGDTDPILKWLNNGTQDRYDEHHKDAYRGRIKPDNPFFDNAIDQTEGRVYDTMTEAMLKEIDKIWNS